MVQQQLEVSNTGPMLDQQLDSKSEAVSTGVILVQQCEYSDTEWGLIQSWSDLSERWGRLRGMMGGGMQSSVTQLIQRMHAVEVDGMNMGTALLNKCKEYDATL